MAGEYFDYRNQAWFTADGVYVRCGHPSEMSCGCFGRKHEGEPVPEYILREYGAGSTAGAYWEAA